MLFKRSILLSLEPKVEHKLCVTYSLADINDTVLHLNMAEKEKIFLLAKRKNMNF